MTRRVPSAAVVLLAATVVLPSLGAIPARAQSSAPTLVLPLRSIGVSDETAFVSRELLVGSLRDFGVEVVSLAPDEAPPPSGADACDDAGCAAALARRSGASQVVYGSLSKLGTKIIARLSVLRVDEPEPYYRDQLTASTEEDLDRVMRRFAEGISTGRPNSDRATVESVTQIETMTPSRRASRSGLGIRAGFLFPAAESFGGADRLTNLRLVYKYELRDYQIESSTVLGFTWGEGNFDWTILDLGASRIFGTGDISTYLGLGIGVHTVTVEQRRTVVIPAYPSGTSSYEAGFRQTETAPTLDLMMGVLGLRTYDFEVVLEIRYHYVFEKFNDVGGNGAQGLMVTFGTNR